MFSKQIVEGHKKAFVFGTGGGNDIVNAVLVSMYLQRHGIKTDVGGILSPAAVHSFDGNIESVVNMINSSTKREIPTKISVPISFIDESLPFYASQMGIKIPRFYDLSVRFGTQALVDGVKKLVARNKYDLVVGVDVGGDILARGKEDSTILSPAMDFSSLYLLGKLKNSLLVEFGLGTDGELRPGGMKEIIDEIKSSGLLLHESQISNSDHEVQKFRELFEQVRKIRSGHTAVMTLETLIKKRDIHTEYRFVSRLGNKKIDTPYGVLLPGEYAGKVFVIDANGFAEARRRTAFQYNNALEQYVKLKKNPTWKTELDLFCLWNGENWTSPEKKGICMLLLAPTTRMTASDRAKLIKEGIRLLSDGNFDLALLLERDEHYLAGNIKKTEANGFYVAYSRQDMSNIANKTARKIIKYLS